MPWRGKKMKKEESSDAGSASVASSGARRARIYERSRSSGTVPGSRVCIYLSVGASWWFTSWRGVLPYRALNYAPARVFIGRGNRRLESVSSFEGSTIFEKGSIKGEREREREREN